MFLFWAGPVRQDQLCRAAGDAARAGPALYLATAEALDAEMGERVKLHRQQRHKASRRWKSRWPSPTALKAAARQSTT